MKKERFKKVLKAFKKRSFYVFIFCNLFATFLYFACNITDTTMSVLKKINPKCEIEQLKDTTLSSAWIEAMSKGQQPSAPEDYIEVEQ